MVGGPISGMIHRPSLAENVRTASRDSVATTQSTTGIPGLEEEKPLASGNGVSLSISLAEPVLFLQGFDQSELGNQTTTMLRGNFHLRVSKSAKIKAISLAFRGRAETEWPEGQCKIDLSLIFEKRRLILNPSRQASPLRRQNSKIGKAS